MQNKSDLEKFKDIVEIIDNILFGKKPVIKQRKKTNKKKKEKKHGKRIRN
tara:strand:+ start:1467 stop:1616 length:150 start_codon:yes stop_codon:yes gene_type:complete